ncbi:MAG TPA: hypothetical protein VE640_03185 [Candidatus Bathyarchaeia archaeon]|nr:hypothetical protein [Candidatus Bathyarchaeia archaeon]
MTTRRSGRPSQVRPRPPSTGRPSPTKVRPRAPAPGRLAQHRRVDRGPGIALPFRALLAVLVVALGAGVLLLATGGLGKVVAAIGPALGGFVTNLTTAPSAGPSAAVVADAPVLVSPDEPYTNQATVDLVGHVPAAVAGSTDSRIRLYVAIGDGKPGVVTEVAVGASQQFLIPGVQLSPGVNAFTATIVGSGGLESDSSAVVTYILDTTKPRLVISAPKNGATVNARTVQLTGQTQARSTMSVRNLTTNATVTGAADETGAFNLVLPIGNGVNQIEIDSVDPAGNQTTVSLAVRRGTGALKASLAASVYSVRARNLPDPVTLTVAVSDPNGQPLKGANVTFTLAVPGVPVIASSTLTTSGDGTAAFTTSIPKGATPGLQASVTVIVHSADFGDTTARTVIAITR